MKRRRAHGHGIRPVSSHRDGLAAGVQGTSSLKQFAEKAASWRNKAGERFMEKYDPSAWNFPRATVVARSIYTEVKEGRGTEHGGAYLDISHKPPIRKEKLPQHVYSSKNSLTWTLPKGPMESGPHLPLHEAAFVWTPKRRKPPCPVSSLPVKLPQVFTVRIASVEFALPICSSLAAAPDYLRPNIQARLPASIDSVQNRASRKGIACAFFQHPGRGNVLYAVIVTCRSDAESCRDLSCKRGPGRALVELEKLKARAAKGRLEAPVSSILAGTSLTT